MNCNIDFSEQENRKQRKREEDKEEEKETIQKGEMLRPAGVILCLILGAILQKAGVGIGAGLAIKKGIDPAQVDTKEIREILRANGAILEV